MTEKTNLPTWEGLLDNPKLIGGQLFFHKGRHYVGEIERVRNYGHRATFHFSWTAASNRLRGWTTRKMKKVTLKKEPVQLSGQNKLFMFGGNTVVLNDQYDTTTGVKKESVLPQLTHHDRRAAKRAGSPGPGPLFE